MLLAIDLETYSPIDLRASGAYAYAEEAKILLFGYAFDDEPVQVVELARGEKLPERVLAALTDPIVTKTAWNAAFEIQLIRACLGIDLQTDQWSCTMVHALYIGLPGRLDQAAKSLRLDMQKDAAGTRLINFFSKPDRKGEQTPPEKDLDRWEQFVAYCRQDVEVEREARKRLSVVPLPAKEQELWVLDQEINRRGVLVDLQLADNAVKLDLAHRDRVMEEAKALTGIENPNSPTQVKDWIASQGFPMESLNKAAVQELLDADPPAHVRRMLELRQEMSRTSVAKYEAMQRSVCKDGRVRGLVQFYGANRTGRWAGRLVQVQNLPRNTIPDIDLARQILKYDPEALEMLWPSVPVVLSQLIRTALIPAPGHVFISSDFSAIEARVVAWLAGEEWRLDVFRSHGKIYEASASQMFGVPIEEIDRGSPLRQKGKVAELALGYQGAKGALIAMGALTSGLSEEELPGLVQMWRDKNPRIVGFWRQINDVCMETVQNQTSHTVGPGIHVRYVSGTLQIELPSGRCLHYVRPRIELDPRFGRYGLTYEGNDGGAWGRLRTFGGKLTENITQAVARDCLAEALLRLRDHQIVFHVHDEVVVEAKEGTDPDEIAHIMGQPIDWAPGLPLGADAFSCQYYQKGD